jgi:hypothetical protein
MRGAMKVTAIIAIALIILLAVPTISARQPEKETTTNKNQPQGPLGGYLATLTKPDPFVPTGDGWVDYSPSMIGNYHVQYKIFTVTNSEIHYAIRSIVGNKPITMTECHYKLTPNDNTEYIYKDPAASDLAFIGSPAGTQCWFVFIIW